MNNFQKHSEEPNSFSYPSTVDERRSLKRRLESAFSIINTYLWFRGIGFTEKLSCKRNYFLKTIASIGFLIIFEANFVFMMYDFLQLLFLHGVKTEKDVSSFNAGALLKTTIRFLFYTKRRALKDNDARLIAMYLKVFESNSSRIILRAQLFVILLLNDVFYFICLCYYFNFKDAYESFTRVYGKLPFLSLRESYHLFTIAYWYAIIHPAVVAYFWSICFVLKESLIQLKCKLDNGIESKTFIKLYGEINDFLLETNNVWNPFLLTCTALLLVGIFRETYYAVFLSRDDVWVCSLFAAFEFLYFASICLASSSVTNALEEVKCAIQKHSRNLAKPESLQLMICMNERFEGFKILNSIALDSSLVLTATGALFTYGMLIASLNNGR